MERLKWPHAALILLAIFLAANWQILAGRVFERWDAYVLGAPAYSLLADFARSGRIVYWDPWIAGGSPDFAIVGSAVFSPEVLLFALITGMGHHAYLAFWLIVWLSGGMGILLLARHLQVPVWGGLAVALGFVFSGFYTGHAEHTSVLYSYSALPFILWRLDVAFMQRRFLPAAQAGAIWGLSALAGYPALTVSTVGLVGAWGIGRYFFAADEERAQDWKRGLLYLLTMGAIGVVILSPAYISGAYEGRGYSDRSAPLTREFALNSNALHPGALATLSSPALIGLKLFQRSLWSYTDVSSANLYTGGVTLLLALLSLTSSRSRRWRWFLGALALFALACAISVALPLRGWLFDLLPPTRFFRHSSMLRGFVLFLFSILALFGARDLAETRRDPAAARRLSLLAPLLALPATIAFVSVLVIANLEHRERFLAGAHFVFLWGSLTLAGLMMMRGRKSSFLPAMLLLVALVDGIAASHFSEGTMYSKGLRPKMPFPASSSVDLGAAGFWRALGAGENVNQYFKVPAFRSYAPFENGFQRAIAAKPILHQMAIGDDRTWFAPAAPAVAPTQEAFDAFAERVTNLRAPIILRHPRAAMLHDKVSLGEDRATIEKTAAAILAPTNVDQYLPEKLVLETTVPSDGWLMVTERWSRSWRATVNGIERPVEGANFIFRLVPVVRGRNRIEFSYHPFAMPALLIASWSMAGLVGLWSLVGLRKRRPADVCETEAAALFPVAAISGSPS
ncbi:MAG: hypothetical protein ACR2HH_12745 [Chthoniobacterales bacterium]